METECECCGQSDTWYAFGMCRDCIKSLPSLRAKVERLEAENTQLLYRNNTLESWAEADRVAVLEEALQKIYDNAGDHDLIVDVASAALEGKQDGL